MVARIMQIANRKRHKGRRYVRTTMGMTKIGRWQTTFDGSMPRTFTITITGIPPMFVISCSFS